MKGELFGPSLDWSPDGSRISYVVDGRIHITDADGSNRTLGPSTPDRVVTASWSPDGTRFAYTNGAAVSVIGVDGSDPTLVVASTHPVFSPAWSPDGQQIAVFVEDGRFQRVVLMQADGSKSGCSHRSIGSSVPSGSRGNRSRPTIPLEESRHPSFRLSDGAVRSRDKWFASGIENVHPMDLASPPPPAPERRIQPDRERPGRVRRSPNARREPTEVGSLLLKFELGRRATDR